MGLQPPGLGWADAIRESALNLARLPARTAFTGLATALAVATIVATLGVVETANHQVSAKFNALAATQVVLQKSSGAPFSPGGERRVRDLRGVVAAGVTWTVQQAAVVRTDPLPDPGGRSTQDLPVLAATPGALRAMDARVQDGRLYDSGNQTRQDLVAVLGSAAARSLGINRVDDSPAVFIDNVPFTVVGIVGGLDRDAEALLGIMVPSTDAPVISSDIPSGTEMLITTAAGAAQVVGGEAAYAADPVHPRQISAIVPPDPTSLRRQVEGTTSELLLLLGALAFVVGVLAIVSSTLLAVRDRIPEIGLRRAIGARPRDIALTTLLEAAATGGLGGVLGADAGLLTASGVALAQGWTAVLNLWLVMAAPAVGVLAGLLAGTYPAWRATRIEPISALQR